MTEVTSFEKRRIEAQAASFDAFNIGDVHVTYGRTVTQTHLVNFTAMAGMQLPLFINHNLAQDGPYGEPIVPGFLTASLSGGMMESVLGTNTLAGLGMDGFRFKTPVKMGDTLHAEIADGAESRFKDVFSRSFASAYDQRARQAARHEDR